MQNLSCILPPHMAQRFLFILTKSDSALKIQLRSHLLQEVAPECFPLTCILISIRTHLKCLFSAVPGLILVYVSMCH